MSKVLGLEIKPIKGVDGWRAFNAYQKLLLGVKMLPAYAHETYEDFYDRIDELNDEDKLKILKEAVALVELEEHEIEALAFFCRDANGQSYRRENLPNLGINEIFKIVVAVCFEISKINVDFLSDDEKKN